MLGASLDIRGALKQGFAEIPQRHGESTETMTTTTKSQRGRHSGAQQTRRRRRGAGGGNESLEGRRRDERGSPRGPEGESTASREPAKVEESRQTRRQTRSGRRSTRTAAPERMSQKERGKERQRDEHGTRRIKGRGPLKYGKVVENARKKRKSEGNLFRPEIKSSKGDQRSYELSGIRVVI